MPAYLSPYWLPIDTAKLNISFPVRGGDVADVEAESRELPRDERLSGERYVDRVDRLLPGVEPFAAVRWDPEALLGPGVLELRWTPLVVEVLDLRDHQADAVRLRATPEPERSHEPRQEEVRLMTRPELLSTCCTTCMSVISPAMTPACTSIATGVAL
jgi:hypothetical protein